MSKYKVGDKFTATLEIMDVERAEEFHTEEDEFSLEICELEDARIDYDKVNLTQSELEEGFNPINIMERRNRRIEHLKNTIEQCRKELGDLGLNE